MKRMVAKPADFELHGNNDLHCKSTHLGQISGFSDTVHAAESDDVRCLVSLGLQHITQDIDTTLRGEDLNERLVQALLYSRSDS